MANFRVRFHFRVMDERQWMALNNLYLSPDAMNIVGNDLHNIEGRSLVIDKNVEYEGLLFISPFSEIANVIRQTVGQCIVIADYVDLDDRMAASAYFCEVGDISEFEGFANDNLLATDICEVETWMNVRGRGLSPFAMDTLNTFCGAAYQFERNNDWTIDLDFNLRHNVFCAADLEEVKVIAKTNMTRLAYVFGGDPNNGAIMSLALLAARAGAANGREVNAAEKALFMSLFDYMPPEAAEELLAGVDQPFSDEDVENLRMIIDQAPAAANSLLDIVFAFMYADGAVEDVDVENLEKIAPIVSKSMRSYYIATHVGEFVQFPEVEYAPLMCAVDNSGEEVVEQAEDEESDEELTIEAAVLKFLKDGKKQTAKKIAAAFEGVEPREVIATVNSLIKEGTVIRIFDGYNNYYCMPSAFYAVLVKACDTADSPEAFEALANEFALIYNYEDASEYQRECFESILTVRYENALSAMGQAETYEDMNAVAAMFEALGDYRQSEEYVALCYERAKELLNARYYDSAMAKMAEAQNAGDYAAVIEMLNAVGDYSDAYEKIAYCNEKIEYCVAEENNWATYRNAMATLQGGDISALMAAADALDSLGDWRDASVEAARIRNRIESIKLENEKARINADNKKRRKRNLIIIAISSAVALAVLAVLTIFVFIPLFKISEAESLIAEGKYQEAKEIYIEVDGFGDSDVQIEVINGIEKIEEGSVESIEAGVKQILTCGVPVEITYDVNGGSFDAKNALSIGHLISTNNNVVPLSAPADGSNTIKYNAITAFDFIRKADKTGFKFVGWDTESSEYSQDSDNTYFKLTLKAKWEIITYKVEYDLGGGELSGTGVTEYTIESNAFKLPSATRVGYTFGGWIGTGLTAASSDVTVNKGSYGDRTYTAVWNANKYTVTFDPDGGALPDGATNTKVVSYDEVVKLPVPTKKGNSFGGWYSGNTKYSDGAWKTTSNVTLKAKWNIETYTITYNLDGGTNHPNNPKTYTVESSFTLGTPTKTGYEFIGWTFGTVTTPAKSVKVTAGSSTGNIVYTANWKIETYYIFLDTNGGNCSKNYVAVEYGSTYSLPTPYRAGYTFAGWYSGNVKYDGTNKIYGDVDLVAKWVANQYTVSFRANGGSVSTTSKTVTYGEYVTLPTPYRSGYTFLGWYTNNGSRVDSGIWQVSSNVTLYAEWEEN